MKKTIDPVFAEFARTAPRLDIEFYISHTDLTGLPFAFLEALDALHAATVRDESKGRNASKHKAAYQRLRDTIGQWRMLDGYRRTAAMHAAEMVNAA